MKTTQAIISALIVLLTASLAAQENNAKPSAAEEIHAAAAAGDLARVRALLETDPALLESKEGIGYTPLHRACLTKQVAVAKFLLDKGANVNARDDYQFTPLHRASGVPDQDLVLLQSLIDKGADVNAQGYNGLTPLHWAAFRGGFKVAKLLLDHGADINACDKYSGPIGPASISGTVLQVAIDLGPNEGMAKLLVENGAKLNERDPDGNTELHLAAMKGYADLARLLAGHGADVNAVNKHNRTALYYAAKHGYRRTADALIAAGAERGTIVEANYGKAPQLTAALKEGEAYLWKIGFLGFAVKTKGHLLLFNPQGIDESVEAALANGHLNPNELAGLKITVLITEPERRQNGTETAELAKRMLGIDFVFSYRPSAGSAGSLAASSYRLAAPNESFSMGGVQVHTIPALCGGMGYLVEADGVKVFHAGLHVSDNDASNVAEYRKQIDFLKSFGPIDVAILSAHSHHPQIGPAYEPYLYLIDQLSPKAVYKLGANNREQYTKCVGVLQARNVSVAYPEGGRAMGERFHYLQDRASATPLVGADRDSRHASSVRPSYLEERARFHSKLIRRGPAPGSLTQPTPPAGIETITYASGDLKLRAWLSVPDAARVRPAPALVFFHGGSEQSAFFVEQAQAFRDAGFVVLFPMLRGENGNPGEWESLMGEIDDAAASVRWIAAQPFVDPSRIYTYGHSTGAAVCLLVSLRNDTPVRLSGSSAGLYTADALKGWTNAPFEVNDERERRMRTPIEFIQTMGQRHVTFVGREEYSAERVAEFRRLSAGSKLEIREVDGDHMGCLGPALAELLQIVLSDNQAHQSFRVLHRFAGGAQDGSQPTGSLAPSGLTLYGMAGWGGVHGNGVIFKIATDGAGFQVLHSFGSADGGGENPYGSLRLFNSELYGATSSEKTDHGGTVFRVGTDGGGFQVLHRFSDSEGMWPYESPILSGTTLYGVTTYGGSARGWDGGGTLYRMSADGSDFRVLHTFSGGSGDGKAPHGTLLQSGRAVYGLTFWGGASNLGTLFRIGTDGTDYRVLHHFAGGSSDGARPRGGALVQSGSTIFGMARQGGPADGGVIFSIGAAGSGYRVSHFFEGGANDGLQPFSASLTQSGPLLYGMTSAGSTDGIVFQIKTDGTEFQVLHRFSGSDGGKPVGSLILSGTTLFGMTMTGGDQGNGVIFALDVAPQQTGDPE